MNLADVRGGLGDVLSGIEGLRVVENTTGRVEPPAAVIYIGSGELDEDFEGAYKVELKVVLFLSRAGGDDRAQMLMDDYLSSATTNSIPAAIRADETLGSTVDTAQLTSWEEPGTFMMGEASYIGTTLTVECIA